jgi:uncharacterized protein YjbI with pentapeptide repeats
MATPKPLAERNLDSWKEIIAFYEDFVAEPGWLRLMPLLRLVRHIAASEQARCFRAGQSLYHLVISTAPWYGLTDDDPSVVVTLDPKGRFEISYLDRSGHTLAKQVCEEDHGVAVIDPILARLWDETRGAPLPSAINELQVSSEHESRSGPRSPFARRRNLWRAKHRGEHADLRGAPLSRAGLVNARLSRANLAGANLREARLEGADISHARLLHADLAGANLGNANLTRTILRGALLHGATLCGANLEQAIGRGAIFAAADLTGANLRWADFDGARLDDTTLRRADLRGAILRRAVLKRADLTGADLRGAEMAGATLAGAILRGASLRGANLKDANLRAASLGDVDLSGANLVGANLTGVDLTQARYDAKTEWPAGFDPQWHGAQLAD